MQSIALESLLKIARQETGYTLENLELHRKVKELTEKNNQLNKIIENHYIKGVFYGRKH